MGRGGENRRVPQRLRFESQASSGLEWKPAPVSIGLQEMRALKNGKPLAAAAKRVACSSPTPAPCSGMTDDTPRLSHCNDVTSKKWRRWLEHFAPWSHCDPPHARRGTQETYRGDISSCRNDQNCATAQRPSDIRCSPLHPGCWRYSDRSARNIHAWLARDLDAAIVRVTSICWS